MAAVNNQSALRQLRQGNVERVLGVLRAQGPQSRAEVARRTRLSRTTLSGIVGRLLEDDVVVEGAEAAEPRTPAGRGRPVQLLSLNPRSAQTLGIEIGRERIRAVLADAAHDIKSAGGTRTSPRDDPRSQAAAAIALVRELAERDGLDLRAVTGAGIGTPGPGETAERAAGAAKGAEGKGAASRSATDKGTSGKDGAGRGAGGKGAAEPSADAPAVPRHRQIVADAVAQELDVPVVADNNSRLAALGEAIWGAARGSGDVLYVALSHGVGGGLVAGGRLFRGAHGAAGEVGHLGVDPQGGACWCGGHGCMELYASVPALLRAGGRRSWDRFRGDFAAGAERACAAAERAAGAVGRALAAACTTVNPERIVLGGELAGLGPAFVDAAEAAFRHHAPTRVHRGVPVVPASLDDRGGALGALALALHESPLLAGYGGLLPGRTDSGAGSGSGGPDSDEAGEAVGGRPV